MNLDELIKKFNYFYKYILQLDMVKIMVDYSEPNKKNLDECHGKLCFSSTGARDAFLEWYDENIKNICIKNEQRINHKDIFSIICGGHIFQYFVPEQFIVLNGKYYQIQKITGERRQKEIQLKRASEFCTHRRYYRQCRVYEFNDMRLDKCYSSNSLVQINAVTVNMKVETKGYISARKFHYWNEDAYSMSEDIPERCYTDKDILVVCFNKMYTNILAVFLKELFFTLFPNSWQLLSVAMAENCKLYGRVDKAKLKDELSQMQGDKGVIFIVEDSLLDLGMLDGIAMRFEQVMKIFINYVIWINKIWDIENNDWINIWKELGKTRQDFRELQDILT